MAFRASVLGYPCYISGVHYVICTLYKQYTLTTGLVNRPLSQRIRVTIHMIHYSRALQMINEIVVLNSDQNNAKGTGPASVFEFLTEAFFFV